jgi:hypothetical protein
VHQLFALQQCADKSWRAKKPPFACFLNLKGASDRMQRPMLWRVLQRLGIHGGLLAAITIIYKDSKLSMDTNGRIGPAVSSQNGGKQGCPPAPRCLGITDGHCQYLKLHCSDEGFALVAGSLFRLWMAWTHLTSTIKQLYDADYAVAKGCSANYWPGKLGTVASQSS